MYSTHREKNIVPKHIAEEAEERIIKRKLSKNLIYICKNYTAIS